MHKRYQDTTAQPAHATTPARRFGIVLLWMMLAAVPVWGLSGAGLSTAQTVVHVDANAPDGGDGTAWGSAYNLLNSALTEANGGTGAYEIRVAAGVYYPDENNPSASLPSFAIERDGIRLLGGYPANSYQSGGGMRNPDANPTILSGDVDQDDANADGNFIAETAGDIQGTNHSPVVYIAVKTFEVANPTPITPATAVDGFVITAGRDGGFSTGGLLVEASGDLDAAPTLANLSFQGNVVGLVARTTGTSGDTGAAAPLVANTTFTGNTSPNSGAGARYTGIVGGSLSNVTFANNVAATNGGGLSVGGAATGETQSVSVTNATFQNNRASEQGGAVYVGGNASGSTTTLTLDRLRVWGNVNDNLASNTGYGALVLDGGAATVSNTVIAGNTGGIRTIGSTADTFDLVNVTLSDNVGGAAFAANLLPDGVVTLDNAVIWNPSGSGNAVSMQGADLTVRNSLIEGGCPAPGFFGGTVDCGDESTILDADPRFTRTASGGGDGFGDDPTTAGTDESANDDYGDLTVTAGSPVVEFGSNAALDRDGDGLADLTADLAGALRRYGATVDLGAYEYAIPLSTDAAPTVGGQTGFFQLGSTGALVYFSENTSASGALTAARTGAPGGTGLPSEVASYAVEIESTLDGTFAYTLTLNVTDVPVQDFSTLSIYVTEDADPATATWKQVPEQNLVRDRAGEQISVMGRTSFSAFTTGGPTGTLPVALTSFTAVADGRAAVLNWATASETNNAGFDVQRAVGASPRRASAWRTVATLNGAGTTNQPQSYRFRDTQLPYAANRLTYRLRQVDLDGTESFSDPVTVERVPARVELLPAFPNPTQGALTVRYAVPTPQPVEIALYDLLGRRVHTVVDAPAAGHTQHTIDTGRLAAGTYLLRLRTEDRVVTQRVTVVR
mgnify:CR=1 FL=1